MNYDLVAFQWASLFGDWNPSEDGFLALGDDCRVQVIGTERGNGYSHFYSVPRNESVRLCGGVLAIPVVQVE